MRIEKALAEDAQELTELTLLSKSYWNYSDQQMKSFRDDLTITKDYISKNEVYKLIDKNEIVGYYSFFKKNNENITLDNLFVAPTSIRKGIGKKLMIDFFQRIQKIEFVRATLEADPNAENFYAKFGFKVVGKSESSIKNRFLPIMEINKTSVQDYTIKNKNIVLA